MKKVKLTLIAAAAVFCFACGGNTEADFSLVPVKGANGEYQYIDIPQKGKIVINPQFEQAHLFRDGLALVKTSGKDGKWGYIDKKGKYIIAPTYDYAQDFGDGVAWVQLENQPPMLIDKKGKMVLQIDSLIFAYPFNRDIAGIKIYSQGQELTMFIDKKGKPVAVTAAEENVKAFITDGLYAFQDKPSGKWGYKNKNGEIVINAQFDDIGFFLDGMVTISNGKKWGAIDKKGNIIINQQYDALIYDGNGLFLAKVGKKWGWVNKKNEITINPQFDEAFVFNGSKLAPVKMGDKWGYINREGQLIINPQFNEALQFDGDYAMVVNTERKVGFIDKTGSFVVPPLYDISNSEEYASAWMQNLYGLSPHTKKFDVYERLKDKMEEHRERAIAAASGSFTDSRNNKTYKTIKIGTQTWMAENLSYEGDGYLGLCYGDKPREQIRKPENCEKYGRLYDWGEAMGLDREYNLKKLGNDDNVQGVCPDGWHLPNKDEWNILMAAVGGENVAGTKLRARSGWDSNGTDDYGFAALPSGQGYSSGYFKSMGTFGYWWSATESSGSRTYTTNMDLNRDRLRWDNDDKSNLAGVRCLKDEEVTAEEAAAAAQASAQAKSTAKTSVKSFTDSRDGTAYKTITIGKQTWMAENLNYKTEGGQCYGNKPENCEKYGRLYDWKTATKTCPNGWHLPNNAEWDILYRIADGTSGAKSPYKSEAAGKYLKAAEGWNDFKNASGNGEDVFGFAALPGGSNYSGSSFNHLGNNGYWWSATENDAGGAYYRFMLSENEVAGWNSNSKTLLLSVRCVKD